MGTIVGIELDKARELAAACTRAGAELDDRSTELGRGLRQAGHDPTALLAAHEAAAWLTASGRRIRALVETVAEWSAAAGTSPTVVWHHRTDPAFDDPGDAFAAGEAAADALRRGDDATFERVVAAWAANPVFALTVAPHLGPAAVVEWLRTVEEHLRAPASDAAHERSDHLLTALALVLATASTHDLSPFSLADLVEAARAADLSLGAVALLFAPAASWSTSWLVAAAERLVVPLTAQLVHDGPHAAYRTVGRELSDVRLPVLVAVSRDPAAARQVVARVDLAGLVRADAAYLDDGRALAAVVRAGTWPGLDLPVAERALAHHGALAFIRAVPLDVPLPAALLASLGLLAAPYVGAFRVAAPPAGRATPLDLARPVNPLPALEEHEARAYLDVASSSALATRELRVAASVWTAMVLAGSTEPVPPPAVLHDIGAVRRFVDEGTRGLERAEAARRDALRQQERRVLGRLAGLPGLLPPIKAAGAVGPVAVARLVPDRHEELRHLAAVPQRIEHDQQVLEWQLLAHLWRRRHESRLFDELAAPPPEIVAPDGQLLEPTQLNEERWRAFEVWRDAVAVPTGLDHLGAAYGRSVPGTTDRSD